MAKTIASATLSPLQLATGNGIYKEHVEDVIEQANFAAGRNPEALAIIETGINGDFGPWTHAAYFMAGPQTVYVINIWIDPDVQSVDFSSTATMAASHTGDVIFAVGGWSATHSHTAGATTTLTTTPTTAASPTGVGTGWQTVTVQLNRTSGSTTASARLDFLRIETKTITAANLPGPANE